MTHSSRGCADSVVNAPLSTPSRRAALRALLGGKVRSAVSSVASSRSSVNGTSLARASASSASSADASAGNESRLSPSSTSSRSPVSSAVVGGDSNTVASKSSSGTTGSLDDTSRGATAARLAPVWLSRKRAWNCGRAPSCS